MARPVEYRRSFTNILSASHDQSALLATLQPGETLERVRFQFSLTAITTTAAITAANTIVHGVVLLPDSMGPPALSPVTNPSSPDWIWWEGIAWDTQWLTFDSAASFSQQASIAPRDDGYRDMHAARKAGDSAPSSVWWRVQRSVAGFGPDWYSQVAASVLVRLAPQAPPAVAVSCESAPAGG